MKPALKMADGARRALVVHVALMMACLFACDGQDVAQTSSRYIDPAGGFSIEVPTGWEVRDMPGLKFKCLFGPATNDFSANVNFVTEVFPGSLEDYAKGTDAATVKHMPGYEELRRADFETNDHARGLVIATRATPMKHELLQRYYLFDAGSEKFVITCSRASASATPTDDEFDACVRTFTFRQR